MTVYYGQSFFFLNQQHCTKIIATVERGDLLGLEIGIDL